MTLCLFCHNDAPCDIFLFNNEGEEIGSVCPNCMEQAESSEGLILIPGDGGTMVDLTKVNVC